jgi:hypothetical protein
MVALQNMAKQTTQNVYKTATIGFLKSSLIADMGPLILEKLCILLQFTYIEASA